MINLLEWVSRRRLPVLILALVTAVALQVLFQATGDDHSLLVDFAVNVLPWFALLVYSNGAARAFHPVRLVARPEVRALETAADPSAVLTAAAFTFLGAYLVGSWVPGIEARMHRGFAATLAVLLLGQLVLYWWSALGRFGVRLTPDGIVYRQLFGSLHVPWEALATPYAAYPRDARQVNLYLARPELVRKRVFRTQRPQPLPATGVDAELLARAIHEYANHPDLRPAIGSEQELARFMAIPELVALANRS
ncbi:hypothetical protein [Actinoplanes sp. L3-i22]|uniref:hypothetical protein n=1 Tax=Actinoplanes sp. L3-i22 TaxID=2836373 RepID=UPI001C8529B3|nr:hypothetical protein [Actinoplanes sp. L3-i22]